WLENTNNLSRLQLEIEQQQKQRLNAEMIATLQYIERLREESRQRLKATVQDHVIQAWTVSDQLYRRFQADLSTAELRQLIRETLRDVRFLSGRGYLFVDHVDGQMILNPLKPELEGHSGPLLQDDQGRPIMDILLEAVNNPQGRGFAEYRWYPPGEALMQEKVSYIQRFEPLNWIIGAGDYLHHMEAELRRGVLSQLAGQRAAGVGEFMVLDQAGEPLVSGMTSYFGQLAPQRQREVTERLLNQAALGGGTLRLNLSADVASEHKALVQVVSVPEWNWILVAVMYHHDLQALLQAQMLAQEVEQKEALRWLLMSAFISGVVTLLVAWLFARWLSRGVKGYQRDLKQQQVQLEIAARVFEASSEGMLVCGPDNRIIAVNEAFCRITGYQRDDVVGRNPSFMASGTHAPEFYSRLWSQLLATGRWQGEIWNRRKDQSLFPEWLTISVCRDSAGQIQNFIGTLTDLSEHKRTEQRLRYLAEHDPLTDLPNRFLLADRVSQAVIQLRRYGGYLALLYIDLDRFRDVNEALGHGLGDQVLREIGQRLVGQVRLSDTVARLGGDEFAVLMVRPEKPEHIAALATRLMDAIAQPLAGIADELVITPSVGISVFPDDGDEFQVLLRHAETALRYARLDGRNGFRFYTASMNDQVSSRLQLESDLRRALKQGEFELYYQPLYSLDKDELKGCEALIRWHHPLRGAVSPAEFVPIIEENGMIVEIGSWVLEEACRQGAEWIARGYQPLAIAVNVSARQFAVDLPGLVERVLEKTGFDASLLVIEVTETLLIDDVEQAEAGLKALRRMGVSIALDDFGTGYSSLSYLKRFSLDRLKIDQAFTAGVPADIDDTALTSSILDIARHLRLATVAEGIETAAQRDFLRAAGCDLGQGYFYARPEPAENFEALLIPATAENPRLSGA
ncbi:MAG: EAL domain-containing protein, partial [Marinobacterium sp.]|nr:EAL domain-containing protein [Marinobacterium sp.]